MGEIKKLGKKMGENGNTQENQEAFDLKKKINKPWFLILGAGGRN